LKVSSNHVLRAKRIFFLSLLGLLTACSSGEKVLVATGGMINLSDESGRWLVLNYWADWCRPCKEEIPELNQLHIDRKTYGLMVLGINFDALAGEELQAQITSMNIRFPVLIDDPRLKYGYVDPEVLPMTVLIDPDRVVAKILVGPQSAEGILKIIDSYKG
jgi:peroxiredoxin